MNLKIMRLKLFQESACYKKPYAFKVAETYPLPPYSTIIGMFHKILQAQPGEYYPMNISVQGEYESIFSNYQNLRMYKGKGEVTAMPRNVHQLLNINLIIHVKADDEVIDKIYNNIINGEETFTLGRNEDLVRVDEIKIIQKINKIDDFMWMNHNAYIPTYMLDVTGINYRLNTKYTIVDELRKWEKVDVKYVEKDSEIDDGYIDEDGEVIFWCYENEVN